MSKHLFRGILIFSCILLLFSSALANAETISSEFGPNNTFGITCWVIGSYTPEKANQEEIGASFTPSLNYYLDSIDFATRYFAYNDQLTVYIASGVTEPGDPFSAKR